MRFDDDVTLDTSQISDRRGLAMPLVGGGGALGLVGFLIAMFLGVDPTSLTSGQTQAPPAGQVTDLAAQCRTGVDANNRQDCRIVGVVNSVQQYWSSTLKGYREAPTTFFSGYSSTACGTASTDVGPFYCPSDRSVYIDLSFYDELRNRFGATGGPFAEAYVIAHEYGHHVENQLGVLSRASSSRTGTNSGSVRVELMADCLAGMWSQGAKQTGFIEELTEQDIADGLNAAAAVGDDRIQKATQGRVDKESWTHGSAEQRQRWFMNGYKGTSVNSCDTLNARSL